MRNRDPDPNRPVKYVAPGAAEGVVAGRIFLPIVIEANNMGPNRLLDGSADGGVAMPMSGWFFAAASGMVGIAWRVMVLLPDAKD